MPVLSLLKNPQSYQVDSWPLHQANGGLDWWLNSVHDVVHNQLNEVQRPDQPAIDLQIERFQSELDHLFTDVRTTDHPPQGVSAYLLDHRVAQLMRQHGFDDPYHRLKEQENHRAMQIYPQRVQHLEQLPPDHLLMELIRGILAGNRFDMGCSTAIADYQSHGSDFAQTLTSIAPRPWLVDDFDRFADFLAQRDGRSPKVLFFVDNAGPDFVLGCLPLARALADQGARVVLAANSLPSVNDITLTEAYDVLTTLAEADPKLRQLCFDDRIHLIPSGGGGMLIDLADISPECAYHAHETDLVILEGMGRSVESNHFVEFTCPVLKLCLLKDPFVARQLSPAARVFDVVCRFEN